MYFRKKCLIIFLITVLFCATFLFVPAMTASAASEESQSKEPQKVREVAELRTDYSKTFQMSNGQYQCEIHAEPINYKDSEGKFQEINNSITDNIGKDGYKYSNTANSWHAYFADNITQNNAISIEKDGYAVSFNLEDQSVKSVVQKSYALDKSASEFDGQLAGDDRSVVYKDIYKNVDAAYTVTTQGLKENIILRDKDVPDKYTFNIELKVLDLVQKDGNTYFVNSSGEEIFSLDTMFMEDSKGHESYNISSDIGKSDNGYTLTVTADTNFLNDSNTVFPVILDPSIPVYGSSVTFDSYVCSTYPNTNYNSGSQYTYLRTGKDSPYGVRRTYILFNRPTLPSGAVLTRSYMKLYQHSSAGPINITAYRVTGTWGSSTITWNNKPGYTTSYSSGLAVPTGYGWYAMDVSYWIQAFYSTTPDYGFCIRDSNESSTSVWATWRSSDYSGYTYDPILTICYNIYNYVSVQVAAETNFRTHNPTNYVSLMVSRINEAADAFYNTYYVDLDPTYAVDFSGLLCTSCSPYNSECNPTIGCTDYPTCSTSHHKNKDRNWSQMNALSLDQNIRVTFVDFALCFYDTKGGTLSGASAHFGAYGCSLNNDALIRGYDSNETDVRTIQHQVSHLFGCHDGVCIPGQRCIMSGGWDLYPIQTGNIWCWQCYQDFNSSLQ